MKHSIDKLLESEIGPLVDLEHQGIVKLISCGIDKKLVKMPGGKSQKVNYIMLELAHNGELFDVLAPPNLPPLGGFNERITRFYFNQLLDALEYLHSNGVCH